MSRATLWALIIGLAAGWFCRGWEQDSVQLTINTAAQKTGEKLRDELVVIAADSARQLETKIEGLKNAQPNEIRSEIYKPVFTNVCVSDDFVRMYNDAASAAERALSGKPADEVPGKTAAPAWESRH
ncbi:hypothetical protein M977_00753 [Buttiauxella gaviniae ATCC 51604]|uniref:Uncharacterized protein n=1 Tax=Buttiauxella gaviniae ATCC 51604 TaxID=1354253 RepID=A0A1B7I4J8_9ENTR|nr:hypothetical protein [Buttiauxella gaviniae]OAT23278.1 hypothetical protein M977_00753 [Buttiauxella gaviniae ATCC 51604]